MVDGRAGAVHRSRAARRHAFRVATQRPPVRPQERTPDLRPSPFALAVNGDDLGWSAVVNKTNGFEQRMCVMSSFTKIRGIVLAGVMTVALAGKAMAGEPTPGALEGNSGQVAALQAKADVARARAAELARQ